MRHGHGRVGVAGALEENLHVVQMDAVNGEVCWLVPYYCSFATKEQRAFARS